MFLRTLLGLVLYQNVSVLYQWKSTQRPMLLCSSRSNVPNDDRTYSHGRWSVAVYEQLNDTDANNNKNAPKTPLHVQRAVCRKNFFNLLFENSLCVDQINIPHVSTATKITERKWNENHNAYAGTATRYQPSYLERNESKSRHTIKRDTEKWPPEHFWFLKQAKWKH